LLGDIAVARDEPRTAEQLWSEAAEVFIRLKVRKDAMRTLGKLAELAEWEGRSAAAIRARMDQLD
jgi:hypothetical protein